MTYGRYQAKEPNEVIRVEEYVRGSEYDNWHWCKNCTQYPFYVYQQISVKPPSGLCEQCETKEKLGTCQCEDLKGTTPEHGPKRLLPDFCYS